MTCVAILFGGTTRTPSGTRVSQLPTTLDTLCICLTLVVRLHVSRYLELRSTAKPLVPPLLLTTVVLTPLSNSYVSTRDSVVKYSLFSGSWINCRIRFPVDKTMNAWYIWYTFTDNLLLMHNLFHVIPLDLFVSRRHRQHCMCDASRFDSFRTSRQNHKFTCDLLHALSTTKHLIVLDNC